MSNPILIPQREDLSKTLALLMFKPIIKLPNTPIPFIEIKNKEKIMEKELNLVEILKNVPTGIRLYSPIFGVVVLESVNENPNDIYPIKVLCIHPNFHDEFDFTKDGKYQYPEKGECVLFPSKEIRNWDSFQVPEVGDMIDDYKYDRGYIVKRLTSDGFVAENYIGLNFTFLYTDRFKIIQQAKFKKGDIICINNHLRLIIDDEGLTMSKFSGLCENISINNQYYQTSIEEINEKAIKISEEDLVSKYNYKIRNNKFIPASRFKKGDIIESNSSADLVLDIINDPTEQTNDKVYLTLSSNNIQQIESIKLVEDQYKKITPEELKSKYNLKVKDNKFVPIPKFKKGDIVIKGNNIYQILDEELTVFGYKAHCTPIIEGGAPSINHEEKSFLEEGFLITKEDLRDQYCLKIGDYNKVVRWFPESGEYIYYINAIGCIEKLKNTKTNSLVDKLIKTGNYYPTEEMANGKAEEIKEIL